MKDLSKEQLLVLLEHAFGEAMCVQERKVEPRDLNQAHKQIVEIVNIFYSPLGHTTKYNPEEEWIRIK